MRHLFRLAAIIARPARQRRAHRRAGFRAGLARLRRGGNYDYVHANAPPGGCGCFSLNGGNGWVSFGLTHHLAAIGDVAGHTPQHQCSGINLTLISYVFGARYTCLSEGRIHPFGQALVGGAHAWRVFPGQARQARRIHSPSSPAVASM